jgi:transcriptional regulator with XRE-family HTH domain
MTTPDEHERQQTAEIVMYWMRRRGLTRKIFADRLGKSLSWVDKIRNGDRQLDRLSVLKQIAGVLDIPWWHSSTRSRPSNCSAARTTVRSKPSATRSGVRVHQVSALADMQSGGRVIEAARQISPADLSNLPKERRATHALDVTLGYLQWGRRAEAASTLLDADRFAPEEVRCRSLTKQIIADLMHSYPRTSSAPAGLTKLARVTGVTV